MRGAVFHNPFKKLASSTVLKNIIETMGTRALLLVTGIIYSILVTRILGPEKRGILAVAVSIIAIGMQAGNLGLHSSNVYYVAQDRSRLPVLLGNSLLTGLLGGGIIVTLAFLILTGFPNLTPVDGILLILALSCIPMGITRQLSDNLLVGIQDIRGYNLNEIFLQVGMILLILLIVFMDLVSVEAVLVVRLVTLVLSLLLVLFRLGLPVLRSISASLSQFINNFKYGIKAYAASLADNLFNQLDFLMLSAFVSSEQVGFYAVAFAIKNMIYMLPSTVAMIIFPRLCEMDVYSERWKLTKNSLFNTMASMIAVFVLLYLVGKYLIILLYGKAFESSFFPLILLLPGLFFISLDNILRKLLNSHKEKGFRSEILYLWGGLLALKLILNYLFIDDFGVTAVIMNSNLCYFISLAVISVLVIKEHLSHRKGKIHPSNESI